jgi:acyl carrier protein
MERMGIEQFITRFSAEYNLLGAFADSLLEDLGFDLGVDCLDFTDIGGFLGDLVGRNLSDNECELLVDNSLTVGKLYDLYLAFGE